MHGFEGILMTASGVMLVFVVTMIITREPKKHRHPSAPPRE